MRFVVGGAAIAAAPFHRCGSMGCEGEDVKMKDEDIEQALALYLNQREQGAPLSVESYCTAYPPSSQIEIARRLKSILRFERRLQALSAPRGGVIFASLPALAFHPPSSSCRPERMDRRSASRLAILAMLALAMRRLLDLARSARRRR
jgi:hypothetical protein